jgi:hypothetical protein
MNNDLHDFTTGEFEDYFLFCFGFFFSSLKKKVKWAERSKEQCESFQRPKSIMASSKEGISVVAIHNQDPQKPFG